MKCLFCIEESLPDDPDQTDFCVTKQDDKWIFKRNDTYSYQIQSEVELCKVSYCDFVLWTKKDFAMERFGGDSVLPEIVGKWYARKCSFSPSSVQLRCR